MAAWMGQGTGLGGFSGGESSGEHGGSFASEAGAGQRGLSMGSQGICVRVLVIKKPRACDSTSLRFCEQEMKTDSGHPGHAAL